nr:MAG TPA: hypothetical protein [Caudoviricetes sp.]
MKRLLRYSYQLNNGCRGRKPAGKSRAYLYA